MTWNLWRRCTNYLETLGCPGVGRFIQSLRPLATSFRMPRVVLYTRQGCHLCEQAVEVLERHGLEVSLVDIDQDAALRARYDCCVPVVEIDGRVRFRGRVNEVLLRRLLAARSDRSARGAAACRPSAASRKPSAESFPSRSDSENDG